MDLLSGSQPEASCGVALLSVPLCVWYDECVLLCARVCQMEGGGVRSVVSSSGMQAQPRPAAFVVETSSGVGRTEIIQPFLSSFPLLPSLHLPHLQSRNISKEMSNDAWLIIINNDTLL